MRVSGPQILLLALALILIGLSVDPAVANRFETIGGGVSGSHALKLEYLKIIAYVVGGIFILAAALTVITHKHNAQMLSYTTWKSSAIMFLLLGVGGLTAGYMI